MKNFIFILFLAVTSNSILAMEPVKEKGAVALSQEERDTYCRQLIHAIKYKYLPRALELIKKGANVNYTQPKGGQLGYDFEIPALVHAASSHHLLPEQRMLLVRELLAHGADVNLANDGKSNALMASSSIEVNELLLDAGANIYYQNSAGDTALSTCAHYPDFFPTIQRILAIATQLTQKDKDSVKNWLLTEQRLRQQEKRGLVKDLRRLIANEIISLLVADMHNRVIKTGAISALDYADMDGEDSIFNLLGQHLDISFIKSLVRNQIADSFKSTHHTAANGEFHA